jgi:hypothetical protein
VVQDAAILVLIVAISVLPYLGDLGFHSDDWSFLATMETAPDQSFAGRYEDTLEQHEPTRSRPVQVLLQVALHSAFGTRPLGYHIFNAVILATVAVVMLLALRQLRVPRLTAWCVTAIFILLPSYATNRFWFAAFGYSVMMATYFFSLVADLQTVEGPSPHPRWGWKAAAIAGLVLCGLGYELAIPFLLASPLLVSLHSRRTHGEGLSRRYGRGVAIVLGGSTYVALAGILVFKAATSLGVGLSLSYYNVMRLVLGWATVHFGSYGAGLPYTTLWATSVVGPNAVLLSALAAGTAAGWTAHLTARHRLPSLRAGWIRLVLVGLAVYVLGLAIFLTNGRFVVTSTGIGNRVGMAAAVGGALVLVGLVFLLASWFPAPAGRNAVVALAIGAICGSCVLVTSAVATYWATAYRKQQQVLSAIEDRLPSISSQATLIVDGVCPYHGPAIVFESDWDLTGALRIAYDDRAVRGDVVQSDTRLEPRGLRNRIYIVETFHPFAADLLLFDVRDGEVVSMPDATVARRHLESSIAQWTERCLPGREGRGVPVLRTDQVYIGWEDHGFQFH